MARQQPDRPTSFFCEEKSCELQHVRHCDIMHTEQNGRRCLLIQVLAIKKKKNKMRWRCLIIVLVLDILDETPRAHTRPTRRSMRFDGAVRPRGASRIARRTPTHPLFTVCARETGLSGAPY